MEIRRDFYLDKLIKKKNNGLIKGTSKNSAQNLSFPPNF